MDIVSYAESHNSRLLAQSLKPFPTGNQSQTDPFAPIDHTAAGALRIIHTATMEPVSEAECDYPPQALEFSPDDRSLFTAGPASNQLNQPLDRPPAPTEIEVVRREVATENELFRRKIEVTDVFGVSFKRLAISPNGKLVAVSTVFSTGINQWKSVVFLLDAETGRPVGELTEPGVTQIALQFSPDSSRLALAIQEDYSQEFRGFVSIWDLELMKKSLSIPAYEAQITSIAFTPDGRRVVSGGAWSERTDGEICFWDPNTGERIFRLHDFSTMIKCLAFDPADESLIYVERNGTGGVLKID